MVITALGQAARDEFLAPIASQVFVGGDFANGGRRSSTPRRRECGRRRRSARCSRKRAEEGGRRRKKADKGGHRRNREAGMADLRTTFAGIESPNPFWLASGPPTNTDDQVARAFDAGWGGAVWKTIGEPIVNVFSRYGSVDLGSTADDGVQQHRADHRPARRGQPQEIAEVKRNYPHHAVIVVADGGVEARSLARHRQAHPGHRRRRHRAELRLPARHERARHGQRGRPGARLHLPDRRVGEGSGDDPGDRQAHAQRHRHHLRRAARRSRAAPTPCRSSTPSTRSWASTSTASRRGPTSAASRATAATAARR